MHLLIQYVFIIWLIYKVIYINMKEVLIIILKELWSINHCYERGDLELDFKEWIVFQVANGRIHTSGKSI